MLVTRLLSARPAAVLLVVGALGAGVLPAPADARDRVPGRDRFAATARVIEARPVHANVTVREPRLDCAAGGRHVRDGRRVGVRAATVAGAALGGLVGHRIARGESDGVRIGATIAGSLVGSGLGRRIASDRVHRAHGPYRAGARHGTAGRHGWIGRHAPDHRRGRGPCVRVVETRTERRLTHYEVTYVFRDRTFRTRRADDPGDTIDIDVSLPPSRR